MKNQITLKDNKWVWPSSDENSWQGQNESLELVNHLLPFIQGHDVMIQAGGNCGFILNTFIPHFKHIYTFEPDPVNFYCLNQNITDSKVIKLQSCLGNIPTPVLTQQLIRPEKLHDIGGVHISGEGHIPTITIDSLNLPKCDLIQLDVEGYELNALLGGIETIKKYHPVLCIEFCEKWLNRYNTTSSEILELLESLNYKEATSYRVDRIFIYNEL
jgi:FkbM family methyltransferase